MKARLLALLVALALWAPALAFAAPTTEERLARAKFDEGLALSDAGRWPEALEAFRESDRLKPAASPRYNIAASLRALGHWVEAKRVAQNILDDPDKLQPKPKLLEQCRALIEEVEANIAHVELAVRPASARVEVDGEEVAWEEGERVELDKGRHVFVVRAKGYDTATVTREVEAGESRIELRAKKRPRPVPKTLIVDEGEEETPAYQSWWLWTTVGGLVAATAAVVIVVVVVLPEDAAAATPPPTTVGHPIPAILRF